MDPRIPGELQRTRDVHLTSTVVRDDHLATTAGFFTSMSPGCPNSRNMPSTSSPYMQESFSYMGGQIQEPSWRRGLKRSLPESPGISPSPMLGAITSNSSTAGIANTASAFTTSGVEDGLINPTGSNPSNKGKKRSRASRRAPTTVLTTDTSNFRQMVQEFTGIPASPFSATSSLSRSSLMLGSASGGVGIGLPPFLLRPFAQKPQNSTSQLLSSLANNKSNNSSSNTNITTAAAAAAASLGMNSENNLIFPLDNQYNQLQNSSINNTTLFDIQSLINSAPKFHLPNYFTPQSPPPQTKIGGGILDELINNNPLHISMNSQENQQAAGSHLTNPMNNRPNSRLMIGGGIGNIGGGGGDHEEGMCLRTSEVAASTTSTNYTTSSHTGGSGSGTSCKVNSSSGSPDFHLEKGSDSLSRGEGMVDSWICFSQD